MNTSSKKEKIQEFIPDQELLEQNQVLLNEINLLSNQNHLLQNELQSLKMRLAEAEELKRAISEGDLDALVIHSAGRELIFTLDSADRAYRALVETMNEGTVTLTSDGTIFYCNRQFAELLRMSPQSIIGSSIHRFIEPEYAAIFKAFLKHGKGSGEIRLWAADGASVPVYLSISSLKEEESPNAWCLVFTDLTEQKKSEEIVASERLARSIIEQAAEAIIVCDISGRIIQFSNSLSKFCECDSLFQQFEDIIDLKFSEGANAGKSIFPVSDALNGTSNLGVETIAEFKDCQKFHLLLNSGPLKDNSGNIIGCVLTLTDITKKKQVEEALREAYEELQAANEELQAQSEEIQAQNEELQAQTKELHEAYELLYKSEEQFRTLAENSPDVIARFDGQNRHMYANPTAAEVYGHFQEDIIGKTHSELGMDIENLKFWERHHNKVFTKGLPETMEFDYTSPQGKEYYFNTKIVPEFVNGKVESVLAISRDITYIREAETKLKETLDNLEELVKERTAELEKTYNSLKKSEKGLAEAQRIAHIGNWEWDLVTNEVHCSDELCRIFKYTPEEPTQNFDYIYRYVHSEDPEYVDNSIKKALNGEPISIDHRILLDDGEERSVHEQIEVIFDEKNTPVRLIGIIQDVTERKKAEEKIKSLATIVESSNDAVLTKSLDGTITSWNKGAEKIYGYSAEEILGKKISILEWGNIKGETEKLIQEIKQEKMIRHYETLRLRKDGTIINVSITLSPIFDASRKLVGISSIARDITENVKAKEALRLFNIYNRSLIEASLDPLVTIGRDGKITDLNKATEMVTGYSRDYLIGTDFSGYFTEPIKASRGYRKVFIDGEVWDYPLEILHREGYITPVLYNASVYRDENDEVIGVFAAARDITERKKSEELMAKIEISRKKEIHHRIKNNLQVISSLLDLQAEKFNGKKNINDSEVLESFKESQNRVISMALIHEELYRGGEIDTLNFSQYIEELTDNLLQTYKVGNDSTVMDKSIDKNIFFDMDTAIPLGIIVNELISNSLKYAFVGRDSGEIRVSLHRDEDGECKNEDCSTTYILSISDNGIGVPEGIDIEELDSLGLQLVTTLVDQLDGEIELKRNNGTEFTMRFAVTEKNNQQRS